MSDKKDLIPDGYLQIVKESLMEKVKSNPIEAWEYLKSNPIAVLALSKSKNELKKELETQNESEKNNNIIIFFKEYEKLIYTLFSVEHVIEDYGIALTTELLAEKWRRNNQEMDKASYNDVIMNNLSILNLESLKLKDTTNSEVIIKLLSDLNNRIYSLDEYEKKKIDDSWIFLEDKYKNMIDSIIDKEIDKLDDVFPPSWNAILLLSTLSLEGNNYLQKKYSELLYDKLDRIFNELPENIKYIIAPHIIQLKQRKNEIK